ncbi:MAG: ral stress protein [Myxococcaceae bacterium]|jgi:general stress protein YciG|nr:ral stress protein [Myxococcaceae bacterium]
MHDENDRLDPQNADKETTEQTSEQQAPSQETEQPRRRRGFAAMDPKLVSELASRGGKAAQRAGTAHRFNSEEARVAGRKGGQATGAKRRAKSTSN